jgi:hypothetical protein
MFQEISLMYQITAEKFPASLIPVNQEKQNTYTFSTTLKFHTGDKFEGGSGFKSNSSDGWYDLESMPFEVKYKLVNDIYVPDTISNIPLTIKAKASGNLTFGNIESETATSSKFSGAVSYTDLFKNQILNRIEPFNLNVSQAVAHGIYKGIESGELSVISHSVELPRGTIANLAIGSHIVSSDATITLQVNRNVDIISNNNPIKIYKIVDEKLSPIYGAAYTPQGSNGDYNNYTINLPAGINSETKLVIMYQSKIPDSGSSGPFINKATINGVEREFTLNISANQLPDLF